MTIVQSFTKFRILKYLVLSLFCSVFAIGLYSQVPELLHTFKAEQNTLFVKWIPSDVESFKALVRNETRVEWVEVDHNSALTDLNFSAAERVSIAPLKNKLDSLYLADTSLYILAESYLNELSNDNDLEAMNYANALVQNFLDKRVAAGIGNVLEFKKINLRKSLAFRITNAGLKESLVFKINPKEYEIEKIPSEIYMDERKVNFTWDVLKLNEAYCAYNVYRRSEDEKRFIQKNHLPIVPFESEVDLTPNIRRFIDGDVEKGKTYEYQIKGIDYFGDETGTTEIVKITIPLYVDAFSIIDTIRVVENTRVIEVSIEPTDKTVEPTFDQLLLLRSDSVSYGFEEIVSVKLKSSVRKHQFVLPDYETGDAYYYKTVLVSKEADSIKSNPFYFFTLDQHPPDVISNLEGKVDSTGIVRLKWLAPADKDLQGYRVFRANAINEEFQELTRVLKLETAYQDTMSLGTLTNDVYYYVICVDKNFNNSPNSDTILLIKPDTIPPVASVFKMYKSSDQGVYLRWYNSTSEDLKKQKLIRFSYHSNETKIDTLFKWTDTTSTFIDSKVIPGKDYTYELLSFDQSDNRSKSQHVQVHYETGYRQAITDFNGSADRELKAIRLNWSYPDSSEVFSYQIYKAKADGEFYSFQTIRNKPGVTLDLIDNQLKINNKYRYKIKAILNSGISTILSKEIEVDY